MRNLAIFPFGRSPYQFERACEEALFEDVGPAYDVVKLGDARSKVVLAVPGYGLNELDIVHDRNELIVRGNPALTAPAEGEIALRRGIARGAFERRFRLADHIKVTGATLESGLLTVQLEREVPEALRPRKIDITGLGQPEVLESDKAA